ncbi:MAG TPA: glycosyltransferase family 39 protein [Bryobacteraceae bacterium]|nr:glycosyltransferase family 39 protein [Bryobacteraceae bacterium]
MDWLLKNQKVLAAAMIAIGVIRIAATYPVFNETMDEGIHISCGLEWLDKGQYLIEPQHPPLARVMAAMGPFLAGARSSGLADPYAEANQVLHTDHEYLRNLTLARVGVLPFFIAVCAVLWIWTKRLYGDLAALCALFLVSNMPPVLAHAGLATTDMACTAAFMGTLFVFVEWLQKPGRRLTILLGVMLGVAVLSKFSLIPFLALTLPLIIFAKGWRDVRIKPILGAAVVAFAVIWAGYRFSVGSFSTPDGRYGGWVSSVVGKDGVLHDAIYGVLDSDMLPAPELFRGIDDAGTHNSRGHRSYLLGETRNTGRWYFFPIALGVKTPVPALVLGIGGLVWLLFDYRRRPDWRRAAPALAFVATLLFSLTINVNIGVRHVLPLYPLMAMAGGAVCARLIEAGTNTRIMAIGLLALQGLSVAVEHPDYLSYFNFLAGSRPENILVDSDLDWGQDVFRLRDKLRELDVKHLAIVDLGTADLDKLGLPGHELLRPGKRPSGYAAASWFTIKARPETYGWLEHETPVARAGKSILIYYFPP